jgi:hypothetical protein
MKITFPNPPAQTGSAFTGVVRLHRALRRKQKYSQIDSGTKPLIPREANPRGLNRRTTSPNFAKTYPLAAELQIRHLAMARISIASARF